MNKEKLFYSTIRENLINNFFIEYYKGTIVSYKDLVIDNMMNRLPFKIEVMNNYNNLKISLGDNLHIIINIIWEERKNKYNQPLYCITNIF